MEKQRVKVLINGTEYTLVTAEPAEYVQRVAIRVDRALAEIGRDNGHLSTAMLSMLTSINLADQLLRTEDAADNLRKEITEYSKKKIELNARLTEKTSKVDALERKVQELQIELAKSNARNGY